MARSFPVSHRLLPLALAAVVLGCASPAQGPGVAEACCPATAEDWPQFRGLHRDGLSPATGLADTWPEEGPPELWRRPVGAGFSGIAVKGEALYSMWSADDQETLFRLDAATGEEVWRRPLGRNFEEEYGDGPRATPTVDDRNVVYAMSSRGRLSAVRGEDGEVLWEKDLHGAFGGGPLGRGHASSPVVHEDLLVLHVGPARAVVALDRQTGEPVWSSGQGRAAPSSPLIAEVHGELQVVSTLELGLVGFDFDDGRLLWSHPWPTQFGLNIALPVSTGPNRFLIASGYGQGGALVEVKKQGEGFEASPVWENRLFRTHYSAAVAYQGQLYGFDNAFLTCLDASTGEERWKARGYGKGSLIAADGKLIVLGAKGELALVKATPEAHEELARTEALDGKSWTAPSLAGGRVFVRNHAEMAAFDLRASSMASKGDDGEG